MKNLISIFLLLYSTAAIAQVPKGADRNAALRYWSAFALMTDAKLTDAQSKQLDAIATGNAKWDEASFAKLLDENSGAVETMVRGTALPYCEWGVEYDLAAEAPIAQVGRGRALERLNILTAKRLAAQGKSREATDHLLAGLRFGRDLSTGLPLIGALVGAATLTDDFNAALQLNQAGQMTAADRARYVSAVRALPLDGVDWDSSLRIESLGIAHDLINLKRSADPAKMLRDWQIDPSGIADPRPTDPEIHEVEGIFSEAVALFKRPAASAQAGLASLQERVSKLHFVGAYLIPSFTRMNDRRRNVEELRQKVLAAF